MSGAALRRLREERGAALITATCIIFLALLLGVAAVAYAINVAGQSSHDEQMRGAQQAADAGVQQQLYLQSSAQALAFNFNGGALNTSSVLTCVPAAATIGVGVNSFSGYVNSGGQCVESPNPVTGPCQSVCSPGWAPVGQESYYESEFFANPVQQKSGGGSGNTFPVEFPQVVSLGCHTTALSGETGSCASAAGTNRYYRELVNLKPTAPLQAIEAGNDATFNSSLPALEISSGLNHIFSLLSGVLGGSTPSKVGCASLLNPVGPVLSLLQSLIGESSLNTAQTDVCNLIDNDVTSVGAIDGNVSAGHDIYLPATTVTLNPSSSGVTGGNLLGAINATVSGFLNALNNISTLDTTFEYGDDTGSDSGAVCTTAAAGSNPPSSNCYPQKASSNPVSTVGAASFVQSGGACLPGQPDSACTLQRPVFSINSGQRGASLPSGVTRLSGSSPTYSNGILQVPSGSTVQFAAGTYVFCGLDALGGLATAGSGGGVQIFIEKPGTDGCGSASSGAGSFIACGGVNNGLTGGDFDLVAGAVNPSGFQVYVQGDQSYSTQSADTPVTSCPYNGSSVRAPGGQDPDTQVYVAGGSTNQNLIVYAPASEVTVNTSLAFEGSAVGWNVDVTAAAVLQDLDLGTYPLAPVVNAYQPAQTESCDNSLVPLTGTAPTYGSDGSLTSAGDISGC